MKVSCDWCHRDLPASPVHFNGASFCREKCKSEYSGECVSIYFSELQKLREENQRLRDDHGTLLDLLCHCPDCESAPCTMQCRTMRQAKIEVLREVLDNAENLWTPDPHIPDSISKEIERSGLIHCALREKLKQLEGE